MKNNTMLAAAGLACGVILCAASCRQAEKDDAGAPTGVVVAQVGSEVIYEADLESELNLRGLADHPEARTRVLEDMVAFKRLVIEGRALGWHEDEETRKLLEQALARRVRAAHEERLEAVAAPSDEELLAYYEENREAHRTPDAVLGAIMIRRESPAGAETAIRQILESGELPPEGDFGALAIAGSDDQATRYRGGRMRWLGESQRETSQWPAEVFDALFQLEAPGQVSEIVALADGAFVVRLIEKHTGEYVPFQQVAGELRGRILAERRAALEMEFEREMSAKYPARFSDGS